MNYEPVFFFSPFTINHSLFLIVIPEWATPFVIPEWATPFVIPEWATPFVIPEWATPFVIPEWFYRGSSISLSLSYRRRPVSRTLSVIPSQSGIQNPVRHTGAGRYPVFISSWFPAFAGKTM